MEYDVEIKPTKLVKGQGLAKLYQIQIVKLLASIWWQNNQQQKNSKQGKT